MITPISPESLKIDHACKFIQMLTSLGVFEFSGFGISVKLYPDGVPTKTVDGIPLPSAKEAAKEAIEAAKREMAEEDKDMYWSVGS